MKTILRACCAALAVAAVALLITHHAHAQAPEVTGDWTLVFEMPDGSSPELPLRIEEGDAGFTVFAQAGGDSVPVESNYEDGTLEMALDLGHAKIACTMHMGEDGFTGSCEGPEADIPSFMVRRIADTDG